MFVVDCCFFYGWGKCGFLGVVGMFGLFVLGVVGLNVVVVIFDFLLGS